MDGFNEELRVAGVPAILMCVADGARIPFVEIACDIEHHRHMMMTYAAMDPQQHAAMMDRLGTLPTISEFTRKASDWTGIMEDSDDGHLR